jgi:hypothetical protein
MINILSFIVAGDRFDYTPNTKGIKYFIFVGGGLV